MCQALRELLTRSHRVLDRLQRSGTWPLLESCGNIEVTGMGGEDYWLFWDEHSPMLLVLGLSACCG